MDGLIDQVRLSDSALTEQELYINAPEAGSFALLGIGGLALAVRLLASQRRS